MPCVPLCVSSRKLGSCQSGGPSGLISPGPSSISVHRSSPKSYFANIKFSLSKSRSRTITPMVEKAQLLMKHAIKLLS